MFDYEKNLKLSAYCFRRAPSITNLTPPISNNFRALDLEMTQKKKSRIENNTFLLLSTQKYFPTSSDIKMKN